MDKIIGISDLRESIATIIKGVDRGSRYIVTQRSKPKAVLMSPDEVETLEVMGDKQLLQEIIRAKEDVSRGRFTSYQKFFARKLPDKSK